MKTNKIIYWIATGLMCILLLFSATMYLTNTQALQEGFVAFGYNGRIVIPLAILKILAVVAIVSNLSKTLKEWAYFGLLMDFILALEAHLNAQDGEHIGAIIALVLWGVSYYFNRKVYC